MSSPNSVHNFVHSSEHGDDYVEDLDPITLISKLDISNPLHLHPNDSTALTMVLIKLKGTKNYQVLSCAMLLALEGKNKPGFIDGSYGSIMFGLHHQIHTLKQIGSSIADYYHKLNALWKQFDAMIELPRCVSNAFEGFNKHNQLMKLMQFLMGLDDSYMQIRSFILSREVLPDVRSAYATISSEESHKVASSSIVGSSQRNQASACVANVPHINIFQGNTQNLNNGPRPNNLNNNRQGGGSRLVCENCGFNGHTIDRYEQIATLISLIKYNKIGKNVQANIAGANQHMTYTNKELDNILDISHLRIMVGHPNGTEAFISKIGNLKLSNGLVMYDV
ncbi:ribonuclease H-like domain-containing protein [Tanacetum coccineum]|uniref:Ribonuclease H-like domain-containing protein n=1 Tax=Tanacetum coccineum TaxID=301880 RepID=A0ABQ5G623_9ASTR